jgi:hypothetical protein
MPASAVGALGDGAGQPASERRRSEAMSGLE